MIRIFALLLILIRHSPKNLVISSFSILSPPTNFKTGKINRNILLPSNDKSNNNILGALTKLSVSSSSTTSMSKQEEEDSEQYIPFKQSYNFNLPPLLRPQIPPMKSNEISQLSPLTLAYIGDVVYELFIRSRYIYPPQKNMSETQHVVVNNVRAETQSKVLDKFKCKFPLLKEEVRIMSRGRNASSKSGPKRFKKNGENDSGTYQDATAFETLIGYLYIKDLDRCYLALNCINSILDDMDS